VPISIARNELIPKTKQDLSYLAANDFMIYSDWGANAPRVQPSSIDWSRPAAALANYRFVQASGDGNALGRLKFMFPNPYSVYIHDTPAKSLFERAQRTFSHGCIRIQKPREFATFVLRQQPDWTRERIDAEIAEGETRIVRLEHPIKVHVTYLTAFANKDGSVHFRRDIYDRDASLARALFPDGRSDDD
jgi:murein L,D-transpeptidase YcbB/YkuD